MGRHPDDPELQAARGNPGKRPETTAQRIKQARQLAKLLARPVDAADELAAPATLTRKGAEAALAVWNETAPKIRGFGVFDGRFDRHAFAQYCVWTAEFYACAADVDTNGRTIMTPMTNGGEMMRINPAMKLMDLAYQRSIELAAKFGLTPLDRARLLPLLPKVWDKRPDARPQGVSSDLFGDDDAPDAPAGTDLSTMGQSPGEADGLDDIGALGAFRGGARLQ